ncbi:hypothetical protein ACIBQX_18175 [Nonomuraea sp. NPDC049714]|uniref:hypothetical protein n=1 Tax=Nonomuraea sp. NPDC049714 TaxID=3364357 RepID=UPI00378C8550
MGSSKQMAFALACAVVASAVIPGLAGYVSARLEAIESAERSLRALEARLEAREARGVRTVSIPIRCLRPPGPPKQLQRQPPAAALEPDERRAGRHGDRGRPGGAGSTRGG